MQGNTDFGTPGYGGPCPPPGDKPHRYYFRLHALKVEKLDLPADATAAMVGFNVKANTLGRGGADGHLRAGRSGRRSGFSARPVPGGRG